MSLQGLNESVMGRVIQLMFKLNENLCCKNEVDTIAPAERRCDPAREPYLYTPG